MFSLTFGDQSGGADEERGASGSGEEQAAPAAATAAALSKVRRVMVSLMYRWKSGPDCSGFGLVMRVIAGLYRRRTLQSLEGAQTRPMLDRIRETLFNILQMEIPGKVFADLYAGTGAVGIEALSRGAAEAIFVEDNPKAVRVIEANLHALGADKNARVRMRTVEKALPEIDADIWFLGPPYPAVEEYGKTLTALAEKGAKLAIAQHARRHELPEEVGSLRRARVVNIGSNALSFYRARTETDDAES